MLPVGLDLHKMGLTMTALWKRRPPVPVHGGYRVGNFETPFSWFELWGTQPGASGLTADHVLAGLNGQGILHHAEHMRVGPAIDAGIIGKIKLPAERPREVVEGAEVVAWGHPAGSRNLERRFGRVHFQRTKATGDYSTPTCICYVEHAPIPLDPDLAADYWPIDTGMSGGLVADEFGPVGIIVRDAPPTELDRVTELPEKPFEFAPLSLLWDVLQGDPAVA